MLAESHIAGKFQANMDYLTANNVYAREQLAWNSFSADPAQATYMTTWLSNRLKYLDGAFAHPCTTITATTIPRARTTQLYPNPARDVLYVEHEAAAGAELIIRDLLGKAVVRMGLTGTRTAVDIRSFTPGMYLVTIRTSNASRTEKLLVE